MTFYSCDQESFLDQTTPVVETISAKNYGDKPGAEEIPPIEIQDLTIGYCSYFYKGDFTICPRRAPYGDKLEVWATRCGEEPLFIATAVKSDPMNNMHWEFSRKTSKKYLGSYQIKVVYPSVSGGVCDNGSCCREDLDCDNLWDTKISECVIVSGPGGPVGTGRTGN